MVKIFTDSTSDLSKELLEKYNIDVIEDDQEVLKKIATRRGLLTSGELDL